ncbi:hypothetical protein [Mesobacillus foraminis]|uniref:hypothetical protein n=1 Tax=Mesobacillus foraminis TaxID=279826 RepID=UPI0013CEA83E|nr:hypothetical protein [Mesobacillus foraminis]
MVNALLQTGIESPKEDVAELEYITFETTHEEKAYRRVIEKRVSYRTSTEEASSCSEQ